MICFELIFEARFPEGFFVQSQDASEFEELILVALCGNAGPQQHVLDILFTPLHMHHLLCRLLFCKRRSISDLVAVSGIPFFSETYFFTTRSLDLPLGVTLAFGVTKEEISSVYGAPKIEVTVWLYALALLSARLLGSMSLALGLRSRCESLLTPCASLAAPVAALNPRLCLRV